MTNAISWLIIAFMALSFGACALFSYIGTGISTAVKNYPRIERVKTAATSASGTRLIRTGSIGSSGSSVSGGGPSSGK